MPTDEPKCGVCGTDLVSGMFHHCKPAFDKENAELRESVLVLNQEIDRLRDYPEQARLLGLKVDEMQKVIDAAMEHNCQVAPWFRLQRCKICMALAAYEKWQTKS